MATLARLDDCVPDKEENFTTRCFPGYDKKRIRCVMPEPMTTPRDETSMNTEPSPPIYLMDDLDV